MCQPNLKSVYIALPVPEIIAIENLGIANPQSWGRGGRRAVGVDGGTVRKSVGEFL